MAATPPAIPLTASAGRSDTGPSPQHERVPTSGIMRAWLASAVLVLSMVLVPLRARADVPPIETEGCASKRAGDACTDVVTGASGACREDTCTSVKPDGTSNSYTCLECIPGDAPDSDGGCSVATSSSLRQAGPWALAGLLSVLFIFARRRKR